MFNKRKIKEENRNLYNRVRELEEILCPYQQHDFVKVNSEFVVISGAPIVDGYTETTVMCKRCKKIMHTGHPLGSKYY